MLTRLSEFSFITEELMENKHRTHSLFALLLIFSAAFCMHAEGVSPNIPNIPDEPVPPNVGTRLRFFFVNNVTGLNTNDGKSLTQGSGNRGPWKTINHGLDKMTPGDYLGVESTGVTYDAAVMHKSGTSSKWIHVYGRYNTTHGMTKIRSSTGGFWFGAGARYVFVTGFDITTTGVKNAVYFISGSKNIYLNWMNLRHEDIGLGKGLHGIKFNNAEDSNAGVNDIYLKNIHVQNFGHIGVRLTSPVRRLVMNHVMVSGSGNAYQGTSVDGIAGYSFPNANNHHQDLTFYDCTSSNNVGDGFDIGVAEGTLSLINCKSINNGEGYGGQGIGIKTWSTKTILANCLVHGNHESAINIKPWDYESARSEVYMLNNTIRSEKYTASVLVQTYGGIYAGTPMYFQPVDLYVYNNIFHANPYSSPGYAAIFTFLGDNGGEVKESDYNYYFGHSNSNAVYAYRTNSWSTTSRISFPVYENMGLEPHGIFRTKLDDGLSNPGYVGGSNFRLNSGSLAIDKGDYLRPKLRFDIDGIPRWGHFEIGAYLY